MGKQRYSSTLSPGLDGHQSGERTPLPHNSRLVVPQKLSERNGKEKNFCPYHSSNLDHPAGGTDAILTTLTRLLKLHPRTGQEGLVPTALPLIRNSVLNVQELGGPHWQSGLMQKI